MDIYYRWMQEKLREADKCKKHTMDETLKEKYTLKDKKNFKLKSELTLLD